MQRWKFTGLEERKYPSANKLPSVPFTDSTKFNLNSPEKKVIKNENPELKSEDESMSKTMA